MNRKIKRIPQTTLSMKRAFDEFVVAQTAKGLTEPTIKNYHAHFHSISRHIDIEKSFSDLTQTDIDGMIVSMRKSGLATNWTVLHRSTCTACPSVSRLPIFSTGWPLVYCTQFQLCSKANVIKDKALAFACHSSLRVSFRSPMSPSASSARSARV